MNKLLLRLNPALGGGDIGVFLLDPALLRLTTLFFPERRIFLKIVHDEFTSGEGIAAMRTTDTHIDNQIGRLEGAHPMDDADMVQLPAIPRLSNDTDKAVLRHSRIVFEHHLLQRIIRQIPHQPGEKHDRAHLARVITQPLKLLGNIKNGFLNLYIGMLGWG